MYDTLSPISLDLIYLLKCAANGQIPDTERIRSMDMSALYDFAQAHKVTAMAAMALESALGKAGTPENWKQEKEKAIRKNILLDAERTAISAYMEKNGIWHLPLKGVILKDYYPKLGMRQMADNDILFDPAYQRQIYDFMCSRGYTCEAYGISNHDVYQKPPVYDFEMHTALFGVLQPAQWNGYYEDIVSRLIPDKGKRFALHFSKEDFYIFITLHACKHYQEAGTGIRTLLDQYIYLLREADSLDWDYLKREFQILGIGGFEKRSRGVCHKLFSAEDGLLNREEQHFLGFLLSSGAYGTTANHFRNRLSKLQPDGGEYTLATKLRYFISRMLPNVEFMRHRYPALKKLPWLLPLFWPVRLIQKLFTRWRGVVKEIQTVLRTK